MKRCRYSIIIIIFLQIFINQTLSHSLPATVKATYHSAAQPGIDLSWTSNSFTDPKPIENFSECTGDHVRLTASFDSDIHNESVTSCGVTFTRGDILTFTLAPVIPSENYNPFLVNRINFSEFEWVFIEDLDQGDFIDLTGICYETDIDYLAWWDDGNNNTWTYLNNLLVATMATGNLIERGSFYSDRNGTLAIAVFNFGRLPVNVTLIVDYRDEHSFVSETNQITIDTYAVFSSNVTTDIRLTAYSESNASISFDYVGVRLNNFFAPEIVNLSIESSGYLHQVTWNVFDINFLDTHEYEVFVSMDGGVAFQLLSTDLTETHYLWNSTTFLEGVYLIRVRVTDPIGLRGNGLSSPFIAGGLYTIIEMTLNQPEDIQFIEGSQGNQIEWIPESEFPLSYQIFLESDIISEGLWTNASIIVQLDGLPVGLYELHLLLWYDLHNALEDTVQVQVVSMTNTEPSVTEMPSIVISNSSPITTPCTSVDNPSSLAGLEYLQIIALSITLVSGTIISVFTVLIVKWKLRDVDKT